MMTVAWLTSLMSLTKLLVPADILRDHRATWWVYPEPGNTARSSRIRYQKTMRGTWGYDVTCSCGWDSRTGGGLRRYVADLLLDHRLDARVSSELADKEI